MDWVQECGEGEAVDELRVFNLMDRENDLKYQLSCTSLDVGHETPPSPRQAEVEEKGGDGQAKVEEKEAKARQSMDCGPTATKEGQVHFGDLGGACPSGSVFSGIESSYASDTKTRTSVPPPPIPQPLHVPPSSFQDAPHLQGGEQLRGGRGHGLRPEEGLPSPSNGSPMGAVDSASQIIFDPIKIFGITGELPEVPEDCPQYVAVGLQKA